MEKYSSMSELLAREPAGHYQIEFRIIPGSRVLIASPHGGLIEKGTSLLSDFVAGDDFCRFDFQGIRPRDNFLNLHVSSLNYDSGILQRINDLSDITVTVHGFKQLGSGKLTIVGGLDAEGRDLVVQCLNQTGFQAVPARDMFSGLNPQNIVNRNRRGKGIQLEISTQQRIAFFGDTEVKLLERSRPSDELKSYGNSLRQAIFLLLDSI